MNQVRNKQKTKMLVFSENMHSKGKEMKKIKKRKNQLQKDNYVKYE